MFCSSPRCAEARGRSICCFQGSAGVRQWSSATGCLNGVGRFGQNGSTTHHVGGSQNVSQKVSQFFSPKKRRFWAQTSRHFSWGHKIGPSFVFIFVTVFGFPGWRCRRRGQFYWIRGPGGHPKNWTPPLNFWTPCFWTPGRENWTPGIEIWKLVLGPSIVECFGLSGPGAAGHRRPSISL